MERTPVPNNDRVELLWLLTGFYVAAAALGLFIAHLK